MAKIIDIHVHFGAPYDPASGCYWSETFEKTAAYWFMKLMSGSLFKKLTIAHIEKKLLEIINDSKQVDKCVLLAMDKVYDENGNAKDNETHLYVPNTYIKTMSENNTRVLFGASVHPYRTNWKDELEYCILNGRVSMQMDTFITANRPGKQQMHTFLPNVSGSQFSFTSSLRSGVCYSNIK